MSEERADESGAGRHLGELRSDEIGQTLTLLQRPACMTGALRMVPPDQFIGVEIRGVARQVMEGLIAVEPCDVFLTTRRPNPQVSIGLISRGGSNGLDPNIEGGPV